MDASDTSLTGNHLDSFINTSTVSHFHSRGRKTFIFERIIPFGSFTQSDCQYKPVIIDCFHVCEHFNELLMKVQTQISTCCCQRPINHHYIIIIIMTVSSLTDGLIYSAAVIFIGCVTPL